MYRETFNSIRLENLATIVSNKLAFFFFFLISNKIFFSKILPHAKSHKVEIKITEKEDKKQKENILITKKGAKEHRERITRGKSLSPRPIKKGAIERSQ